jgi:hypothetical protein
LGAMRSQDGCSREADVAQTNDGNSLKIHA